MAGKRTRRASILLVISALLLLFLARGGVEATNWDTSYTAALSNPAPGANANLTTTFTASVANNNFDFIGSATGSPDAEIALDPAIPDGSKVGSIVNATTLSIFNGPCTTPITVTIPFMDCTTDTLDTMAWVGTGDNIAQDNDNDRTEAGANVPQGTGDCVDGIDNDGVQGADNNDPDCVNEAKDNNGIPSYCDHYPSFLNDVLDPDGPSGAKPALKPRARYMGHQVVVADAPATKLNFLIFSPEALDDLPTAVGQMGDTYGFIDFVELDNTTSPASPSTITDFCAPLTAIPTLFGTTTGSYTITPGPEPYEVDRTGECADALDNDLDGYVNDGCLVFSAAGPTYTRSENPAPLTGLYGTGTRAIRTYSQSSRDQDNDGISSPLDSCPYAVNAGADGDGDGIDNVCDPVPGTPSPAAPAPNGVDDDADTKIDEDAPDNADNDLDGKETAGAAGADPNCGNALDDDVPPDRRVNDGCPQVGAKKEQGVQCMNNTNDDEADGAVNDGCPAVKPPAAPGAGNCADGLDNDGDTKKDMLDTDCQAWDGEDGECPATSGIADEDQDCYPNRNDNCPLVANNNADNDTALGSVPADLGPKGDGIGDACDLSGTTSDGHFHTALVTSYVCIPEPNGGDNTNFGAADTDADTQINDVDSDDDGDGLCDSTEMLLGSDPIVKAKTPENIALDLAIATGTAAQAPGTCSDFTVYGHPSTPAGGFDNDGDTLANAADPDCAAIANDADQDGVPDTADNCVNEKNQEQIDSDGDTTGDECDTDDDEDGSLDINENYMHTDPKDNSADPGGGDDANPFDFDLNKVVDVTDALTFLAKFPSAVTNPGDERYNMDGPANKVVDVTDALIFLGKFPSSTTKSVVFTNSTGGAVNDIHIEFVYAVTEIVSKNPAWALTTALPSYRIDMNGANIANGGTLTLGLNARRPPVVRCYDWTVGGTVVNGSDKPCRIAGSPLDGLHYRTLTPSPFGFALEILPTFPLPLALNLNLAVWSTDRWLTSWAPVAHGPAGPDWPLGAVIFPLWGDTRLTCVDGGDDGSWFPLGPTCGVAEQNIGGGAPLNCLPGPGDGVDNDVPPDGWIDDGCPAAGPIRVPPAPPIAGENDECFNNDDDDGDTLVNDGCPPTGPGAAPEVACGEAAGVAVDNDNDGWVNDGCPPAGPVRPAPYLVPNELNECGEPAVPPGLGVDHDGDTDINDGCLPR